MIATAEAKSETEDDLLIPQPELPLFMDATLLGYVAQADRRHGTFVRFLDGLTGLIPKLKLKQKFSEPKYETVACKIVALDVTSQPPKILLKRIKQQ